MVNLIDILNNTPIEKFGVLDTAVIEVLGQVSKDIDSMRGTNSRLLSYQAGLKEFLQGFEDGYADKKHQSDLPYYTTGFRVGNKTRIRIGSTRTASNAATASYERLVAQIRDVVPELVKEFKAMKTGISNPYDFVLAHIPRARLYEDTINDALRKILSHDRTMVERLLRGEIDDSFIRQIEGKDEPTFAECVQLGLFHMFRGDLSRSIQYFNEVQKKPDGNELYEPVRVVASNVNAAYTSLMKSYQRLQFARQFEQEPLQKKR